MEWVVGLRVRLDEVSFNSDLDHTPAAAAAIEHALWTVAGRFAPRSKVH